jgi:hypothetical protein
MVESPIIRHFLACEEIVISSEGDRYTLTNLIHAIRPLPGFDYPRIQPLVCLFALMTNGRGVHSFQIELVRGVGAREETVYATPVRQYDLGSDPLAVLGLPIRIENVPFLSAGQYEFRFLCDNRIVARVPLELREAR